MDTNLKTRPPQITYFLVGNKREDTGDCAVIGSRLTPYYCIPKRKHSEFNNSIHWTQPTLMVLPEDRQLTASALVV